MNLNLGQLAALRELSLSGTMASVAQKLGYTPGAVSQQIAALEKSVGAQLITPMGRRVVLTDAGTVLAQHADRILHAEQQALDALRAVGAEVAGPLRLGTFGSTAAALLPPVVAATRQRHPDLDLSSRELDVDEVVAAVRRREVDVAFGLDYANSPMPRDPDVEMITLRTERLGLAVAAGAYGMRTNTRIDLRETRRWVWIMPPQTTPFGRALRTACRHEGFEPLVRHEVADTAVALALAGRGLGATFVTDMMVELNPSVPIVRVELEQQLTRRIVLIRLVGADLRPTVDAITAITRTVVDSSTAHPITAGPTGSAPAAMQ
ncbi:LysR substrate-binding domain-containing protein [Nocardia sp. NPDC050793]|uniref:LysR family transcriptional regulator n=1 Tax=Nocardia sp. NPDC050793 TaxID=3155159 RepID=UPI00340210B2